MAHGRKVNARAHPTACWKGVNWWKISELLADAQASESDIPGRWTLNPATVVRFDDVVIARRYVGAIGKP